MRDKLYETTIALAGIAQAVSLIKDLAQTGKMDEAAYRASIYSILQTDARNISAVYGDLSQIKLGLEKLIRMLEPGARLVQTRYMFSVIRLQKKITDSPRTIEMVKQRLTQSKKQVEYFSLLHPNVIANLADIYLNVISAFSFRIIIWGSQRILTTSGNTDKIRALLLAAIRSSVLWQQVGGSRLQLMFSRGKIRAMAERILADLLKIETVPAGTALPL